MRLVFLIPVVFVSGSAVAVVGLYVLLRALFGKDLLP